MRTSELGFFVVAVLSFSCGPAPTPDAGAGGGGGSLFGGGTGGAGGGGGGGGMGGGGGDADAGFDAGTMDAGQPDAGPSEVFTFRVVQGNDSQPVASVAVRIAGPNSFVDGYSDGNGDVRLALPGAMQRPLELTLTRLDYGVLSIIGLTTEFPTQVRLDRAAVPPATGMISGTISGKQDAGRVVVDSFDFFTTSSTTGTYQSQYVQSSPHPLPIVAMELGADNELLNWVIVDGGTRVGTKTVNVDFSATAEVPDVVAWTGTLPDAGILAQRPASPFLAGWRMVSSPTESWITTGAGSAARDGGTWTGNFTSVTGPLAPNRLLLELTDMSSYLARHRQYDLTPPIEFVLPQVNSLSVTGSTLGNLSATASAPASGFDSFCVTAEVMNAGTLSWRVCTAPGAPFTIPRLPDLPEGLTPSGLSIASPGTQLGALPLLMKFEDPAMRPWLLQNSTGPLDAYRDTFGGSYQVVTGAWR